jgi:acetyl-CoA carboxylase biotin carboxyl carrier protein
MLNSDEIKEFIKIFDQSSLQRLELEQESTKLVLVKGENPAVTSSTSSILQESAVLPAIEKQIPKQVIESSDSNSFYKIVAPIVGTFYSAPEPEAAAFVKVGQKVQEDTVVCVLESMKLFNEVEAGKQGEIVEVLVKDGEFVEYGKPLFLVKPE